MMTWAGWLTLMIGWLGLAALITAAFLSALDSYTRRTAWRYTCIGLVLSFSTGCVFVLGQAWAGGL